MEDLLLGIDVGTSSVKTALVDLRGKLQAASAAEYPLHHIRPAWVEQNPEDWWQGACRAMRAVLAQVAHGRERVRAVAVSCQTPTLLPLDRRGQPLRPAIIWMDRRAEAEREQLAAQLGADEIYRITGNRLDAFFVASRLRWLRHHEPETLRQTSQFVQVNGYINYRLTGSMALDTANAVFLQLRHYASGEWSSALCEACGVEPSQFPPVIEGASMQGEVTAAAAEACGLRPGTPVLAGTVDSPAAALEVGVVEPGIAAEMTGTSTVVILPNDRGLTEPALIALPHVFPGIHLLAGAMVSSGGCLRWFRDRLGQPEVQIAGAAMSGAFDQLTGLAAEVGPGSDGVIFLPYMMGERSPIWNANARGVFFGLTLATSRGALVRAILEGAAFALRHTVEAAARAGAQVHELRSVGGCSRSDLWNQIKADVLGIPVVLPQTPIGSPFGAALLAGMGTGVFADPRQSILQMVRLEKCFEPDRANHARYTRSYQLYRSIYEHLRDDFDYAASVTP